MSQAIPSYDVHAHVGLDPAFYLSGWWPYAATAQHYREQLDRGGLERGVCFPFCVSSAFDVERFGEDRTMRLREGRFPYDVENERLVTEIERLQLRDRLLPLAMFDPGRAVQQQLPALERLAADGRVHGLKTQTTVLGSNIRALLQEAAPIVALAERYDLPMLFHTALAPWDEWAQVKDCLDVAEAYPRVRFNLAHSLRFHRGHLERAAELPNVWVDCSAHVIHCRLARQGFSIVAPPQERVEADYENPTAVLEAIFAILGERYMWGSDTPFLSWCDDEIALLCDYDTEIEAVRGLPRRVQEAMTRTGPHTWLFGEKETRR